MLCDREEMRWFALSVTSSLLPSPHIYLCSLKWLWQFCFGWRVRVERERSCCFPSSLSVSKIIALASYLTPIHNLVSPHLPVSGSGRFPTSIGLVEVGSSNFLLACQLVDQGGTPLSCLVIWSWRLVSSLLLFHTSPRMGNWTALLGVVEVPHHALWRSG